MHSLIAPFALRPMKIVDQANRLMQRAQVLYEKHENIMEPKDREVVEHRMRGAEDFKHDVQEMFWLAQTEEAKLYLNHAQEVLRMVKRIVDNAMEITGQK
jgi:hypothetical protein